MPFPPSYQGSRTDASSATPDDHAADHTVLDQADKDIVAEIVAHEASTTAHGLSAKAPLASPTFTGTVTIPTGASITAPTGLVKGDVGLGNVDNTADTAKPVSTAQQTALNLKADLASPTFTGTVTAATITASGAVTGSNLSGTNTGDQTNITGNAATVTTNANLTGPVTSTGNATAIADGAIAQAKVTSLVTDLAAKAPLASPTFTGTVTVPTGGVLGTPSSINLGNATALPATALPAMTGDVTANAGSHATTLANSGVTAATYGSSSAVPVITFDAKGRATSATTAAIADSPAILIVTRSTFK